MRQSRDTAHRRQAARLEPLVHTWRERGGWRARAYRLRGSYSWDCQDPAAERITLGIDRRCAFGRAADGEVLVCRQRCPAWFSLDDAVFLGWCWETGAQTTGRRRITGYVQGETLWAQPGPSAASRQGIWLADGVRTQCSPDGEVLFLRGTRPVGLSLNVAAAEGWCRIDRGPYFYKESPATPLWELGAPGGGWGLATG